MPRKKPSLFTIEEPQTKVSVTLRESNLTTEGGRATCYGSIDHKKITVRAILKEMEDTGGSFMRKETMFYVAEELSRRMMEKLKRGYAVELLDFGTIFPTMKGKIEPTDTPSKIKAHFDVGFTPSKEAKAVIKNLEVGNVHKVQLQHNISCVCALPASDAERNIIYIGRGARITGKAIKLGGKVNGLYAVPVDDDFPDVFQNFIKREKYISRISDRSKWIQMKEIITTLPKTLDFFVEEIPSGRYVFVIETSLSAGGKELKESVCIQSDVVRVEERKE